MLITACDCGKEHDTDFVIDGQPAKLYVGRYMAIAPSGTIAGDKILSDERIVLLPEAVPTKKTNNIKYETLKVKEDRFSLAINLFFTYKTALLEVDSLCYSHDVYNTYNAAEYEYTPGTYVTDSQMLPGCTIRYDVTPESIHVTYINNATQAASPSVLVYELTDGIRHAKEIVKTTTSESEPYTARYSGRFNVVDYTGIATMQNDDFTFEFDPVSGMFKETEPENEEIGDLEPAAEKIVPECF